MIFHALVNNVTLLCGNLLGREAYLLIALALLDNRFNTVKGTAADEKDILSIDLYKLMILVLSSALRRHVCNCTLKNLE